MRLWVAKIHKSIQDLEFIYFCMWEYSCSSVILTSFFLKTEILSDSVLNGKFLNCQLHVHHSRLLVYFCKLAYSVRLWERSGTYAKIKTTTKKSNNCPNFFPQMLEKNPTYPGIKQLRLNICTGEIIQGGILFV